MDNFWLNRRVLTESEFGELLASRQTIIELKDALEKQKLEFERTLEEGYEEAYQMILELRKQLEEAKDKK